MQYQRAIGSGILGTLIWGLSPGVLLAIPSPELVIGSAASVGQLLALLGATLGGGAAAFRLRKGKNNVNLKAQKRLMIALAASVAFLLLAIGGNVYQYQSKKTERLLQLQKTLNRPAVAQGTQINDPALKETSLLAQSQSPLGIDSAALEEMLNSDQAPILIDVRENAETAMGTIPNATLIRFPDVDLNDPRFKEKPVVLYCQNGNRSSEVCAKLAALGIDCRFIVGGLEKWIVEGREFSDPTVRSLSDLRAIPAYSGKDMLLDTPQIETMVADENVQFVDVRYPGEFALGHLPGAINIPLRALPTAELNTAIAALPTDRPIVTPCYDRRGCFISQVLGYEIDQTGRDFRGRYTVPWEYFVPKPIKPHIAAWLAEQNKTPWTRAIEQLALGLTWIADRSNFLVAIGILALFTRLIILPVALKSDRDQLTMRANKPELAALKKQYKADPVARGAAIKAFYKSHDMTPGRNMLALLFLPVTMLGISAVSMASAGYAAFGFTDLGAQDASYIAPAVATLLAGIYFHMTLGGTRRAAIVIWAIATPLMAVLFLALNTAANLYVIAALALLFAQRAYVVGHLQRGLGKISDRLHAAYFRRFHMGILPLTKPRLLVGCGNKAAHLAKMRGAGLPVPDGVVLTAQIIAQFELGRAEFRRKLAHRICRRLGAGPFAVRSSGSAEDGANNSFAGVYDSVTNVAPVDMEAAIATVAASFRTDTASAYGDGGQSNILIQPMVGGDYSGVLFTRDPECSGAMLLECVKGAGEGLVSGRLTPDIFRFGRKTLAPLSADFKLDFQPLVTLGDRIEKLFGGPQDIEWTFAEGQFSIVQSRKITVHPSETNDPVAAEWARIIDLASTKGKNADQIIFKQDEMAEVLPTPLPLSLTIMQSLWQPGHSVDIACQRLGLQYRPAPGGASHLTTLMGRLYSDETLKSSTAVRVTRRARRRLTRDPLALHRAHFTKFLRPFEQRVAALTSLNFARMPKAVLIEQIDEMIEEFSTDVHSEIETINIAAQFFTDQAIASCCSAGIDPNEALAGASSSPFAPFLHRQKFLTHRSDWPMFALQFGHRAIYDYELSTPRYDEDKEALEGAFQLAKAGSAADLLPDADNMPSVVKPAITNAVIYQSLKETAKHRSLRYYTQIRRAVLCLDRKLGFDGGCFYLTPDEISQTLIRRGAMRELAQTRRAKRDAMLAHTPLPAALSLAILEEVEVGLHSHETISKTGVLVAKCVSGNGSINGSAYVVTPAQCEAGGKLVDFQEGQILVCRFIHPTWLPFVLRSGGVISELGGWLSHMAIVARERNIPMFVGPAAWQKAVSGHQITIQNDGLIRFSEIPEIADSPAATGRNKTETKMLNGAEMNAKTL